MRTFKKYSMRSASGWLIPLFAILLVSSCKNLKQNNLIKTSSDKYIKSLTDSTYAKQFELKKRKVFTYTSGFMRQVKFKRNVTKDTTLMTRRIAIKGINSSGEMLKKEIEWKFRFVQSGDDYRVVSSESRVVRDITLLRQILNSLLVSFIYFWAFMGTTGGSILNMDSKNAAIIILFSSIQFVFGIFLFGSIWLSLCNAMFFLFLLAASVSYEAARKK